METKIHQRHRTTSPTILQFNGNPSPPTHLPRRQIVVKQPKNHKFNFYMLSITFQVFQLSGTTSRCASYKCRDAAEYAASGKHNTSTPGVAQCDTSTVFADFYGLSGATAGNVTNCAAAKFWEAF